MMFRIFLASVLAASSMSLAKEAAPDLTLLGDQDAFRAYLYTYGERPSEACVRRVLDAARRREASAEMLCDAALAVRDKLTAEAIDVQEILDRAAATGNRRALAELGNELCWGTAMKADPARGLKLLREAARLDEPCAHFRLGIIYISGLPGFVEADRAEAKRHLQRAVDCGMLRGLGILALLARDDANRKEAVATATKAASAGDVESMVLLYKYHTFDSQLRDPVEATRWAARGAYYNHPHLLAAYAVALDEGVGTARDRHLASRLLQRAARLGDNDAKALLAFGKVVGRFGMLKNKELGLRTLEEMAASQISEAQMMLGRMLVAGQGVDRDEKRGRTLIKAAADQGLVAAVLWLENDRSGKE